MTISVATLAAWDSPAAQAEHRPLCQVPWDIPRATQCSVIFVASASKDLTGGYFEPNVVVASTAAIAVWVAAKVELVLMSLLQIVVIVIKVLTVIDIALLLMQVLHFIMINALLVVSSCHRLCLLPPELQPYITRE